MEGNYIIWGAGLKEIFILCLLIKQECIQMSNCSLYTRGEKKVCFDRLNEWNWKSTKLSWFSSPLEGYLKTPTFKFGGAWKADRYRQAAFQRSVALCVKAPLSWVWQWNLKVGLLHSHLQIVPVLKKEMLLAVVDQTEDVFSPVLRQAPIRIFPNLR